MNSLNSILIEGNLTKDPVLSRTPKGTSVCNLSVASNRYYKQDEELQHEVSFFDVEVWAGLGETCAEYLTKGRGVRVVGRLKQDRWSDAEGNPRSRIKIVAEHVEFKPNFKGKPADGQDLEGREAELPAVQEEIEEIEEIKKAV
ncbi:MAG: single-stranded DNA-binding protein [Spirochaetota bacterium]